MSAIEDIERKLDKLLKEPNNPQLYNDIGVLLFQLGDYENSLLYQQRAYELDSLDRDILYNYALLLSKQSQYSKAVAIYEIYLQLFPNDSEVIEKAGDAFYVLGRYELAAKMYDSLQKCKKERP